MMFTNKEACTIWEKTTVNHAPAYVRHVTGAVYWQDCRGEDEARTPENNVFIAIPVGSILGYMPKTDDRILPGDVDSTSPPAEALTVMQVKDFLYAAPMMQHIEITAK